MAGPLPDSYRRLAAFSSRLPPGARLYDQGAVPDRFYVVLRGEVLFEVLSEQGEAEVVSRAQPGAFVGHVAALTGRPTSAGARVERESVVLRIPLVKLTDAIREAPELALQLIYAFVGSPVPPVFSDLAEREHAEEVEPPSPPDDEDVVPVEGDVDARRFFLDTATCPVSGSRFQFLRVRTRAVRPQERESDFHVRYEEVNPTWYGVVVCPVCAYASYQDDFHTVDPESLARLTDDRESRIASARSLGAAPASAGGSPEGSAAEQPRPLTGQRTLEDATLALELALRCYELRAASPSRRAVLEHRRAWLEREAGNTTAEVEWLRRARQSYEQAFEADKRLSEEAAARIAYLVGDLSERLGNLHDAAQWLETATRVAPANSAGIARTARDRLQDVRNLIKRARAAS